MSIAFLVAAAFGNLYGSGMIQSLYCISIPLSVVAIMDILEIWIDTLPSQVSILTITARVSLLFIIFHAGVQATVALLAG